MFQELYISVLVIELSDNMNVVCRTLAADALAAPDEYVPEVVVVPSAPGDN